MLSEKRMRSDQSDLDAIMWYDDVQITLHLNPQSIHGTHGWPMDALWDRMESDQSDLDVITWSHGCSVGSDGV